MTATADVPCCCYCGRIFQPDLRPTAIMDAVNVPGMNEQEAQEVAALMRRMLDDGLPLECGACR